MLAEVVTEYLEPRFPGLIEKVAPKEGFSPFIRFKGRSADFGDIELHDDGDEVTIFFGRFTHSHYGNYEDISEGEKALRIAADVFEALNDTFNDRKEFWGSHEGCGGSRVVETGIEQRKGMLSRIFSRFAPKTFYRWSGAIRQVKN